ncbi:MAG: hemolysin secretion protein D, partial [Proteobacteria bacterium]|nr:hemolysin secretion protein D [Pseudomonadota bacterium]
VPYARVYVPEPVRVDVRVGTRARVTVDGRDGAFAGTVRMVRADPTFTPYYALTGDDASRLSWLAEIELDAGEGTRDLPAGLPVRVAFETR